MDLSKLSDADLIALDKGDLGSVSDEGLKYIDSQPREGWFMEGIRQFPSSLGKFYGNTASALSYPFRHPIEFAKAIPDVVKGAGLLLEGEARKVLPESVTSSMDTANPFLVRKVGPEVANRIADTVNQSVYNDYGTLENAKRTWARDPVKVISDVSAATGLGGLATRGTAVGDVLLAASNATNPITWGVQAAKLGGKVYNLGLGFTTSQGPTAISEAAKAGRSPRADESRDFLGQLLETQPKSAVIDDAKQGLLNMKIAKNQQYAAGMAEISKDKTVLDFGTIDNSIKDVASKFNYKGQIIDKTTAAAIDQVQGTVNKWRLLDATKYHTPEGMDALKRAIGAQLSSIPFENGAARKAVGEVYNAIGSTIRQQAPTYSSLMADTNKAIDQIDEIQRTLSLGKKATDDTALRKLQSIMRNNVNTNYSNRISLAKELEQQGGVSLMPSLAGQSLSSWTPRGLAGQMGGLGTIGASVLSGHPSGALLLIPQSPKTMGLMTYGLNVPLGLIERAGAKLGVSGEQARLAGLLAAEPYSLLQE